MDIRAERTGDHAAVRTLHRQAFGDRGEAGFRPGAALGFRKPSLRIPDAGFQARTLTSYEPWMTGTLVYSATFWEHDCVGLRDPAA
jgi:putative acetyltransferase